MVSKRLDNVFMLNDHTTTSCPSCRKLYSISADWVTRSLMNASTSQTNATENLSSAFDVMYQSFMASNDLRDATQHILDLATHMTGAENGSLMLLNGHGQLYVLNSRGLGSAAIKTPLVKVGEGIAGQVVEPDRDAGVAQLLQSFTHQSSSIAFASILGGQGSRPR